MRMRARLPDLRWARREHRAAGKGRGPADSGPHHCRRVRYAERALRTAPQRGCRIGNPAWAGLRGEYWSRGPGDRMNLADRLRDVVRPAGSAPSDPLVTHSDAAAEVLDGDWQGTPGRGFLIVDRTYPPGHRLGRVAVADCLPSGDGLWPRLSLLEPSIVPGRLLFVDLETTGLAGGAGTCAFLVGLGWFEGAAFRVRQLFLAGYAAERAMLDALAVAAGAAGGVVTYNG